jgi:putative membrane protein
MDLLDEKWEKNDRKARTLIISFSIIVFAAVSVLGRYNLAGKIDLPFNVHIFALANAGINAIVTVLLLIGLLAVKTRRYLMHKRIMLTAMILSILFLISYICHHLFAGESIYGDTDGDKVLSELEKATAGNTRTIYLILLATHIPLAGLALPFILFAAYRAFIGEFEKHKKMVRIIWPIWFYVAVTGVIIYFMISPYYH